MPMQFPGPVFDHIVPVLKDIYEQFALQAGDDAKNKVKACVT